MSGAMQSLGQFGSKVGSDPSGAFSTLGSDAWSGLSSAPTQGSSVGQLSNVLQNVAPYAALGTAIPQAMDQYGIYNKLRNPQWGQIPAQAQQNILNTVQGQIGPSVGSAEPIKLGQGVANADYQYQLAAQQNYMNSLLGAGQMGQQPGQLEKIFAALTGGLGGNYSSYTGGSANDYANLLGNSAPSPTDYSSIMPLLQSGMFSGG